MEKNLYKNVMTIKQINTGDFLNALFIVLDKTHSIKKSNANDSFYQYLFDSGGDETFKDSDYLESFFESYLYTDSLVELDLVTRLLKIAPFDSGLNISIGLCKKAFEDLINEIRHYTFVKSSKEESNEKSC